MQIIDQHVERITETINRMINRFQDVFNGHQFLRMHRAFEGVPANNFVSNFEQQFNPDEQILEFVRRMSLRDAE